jgi:hypothetical protein
MGKAMIREIRVPRQDGPIPVESEGILCACQCSFFVPKRPNQRFATDKCRYRFRDRQRYDRQKKALVLAQEVESMIQGIESVMQKVSTLTRLILDPEEGKRP